MISHTSKVSNTKKKSDSVYKIQFKVRDRVTNEILICELVSWSWHQRKGKRKLSVFVKVIKGAARFEARRFSVYWGNPEFRFLLTPNLVKFLKYVDICK